MACKDVRVNGRTYSGVSKVMARDCNEDKYNCYCNEEDATATSADILKNKTAYVSGEKLTGNIETYDGEKNIDPSMADQTLNTKNRLAYQF